MLVNPDWVFADVMAEAATPPPPVDYLAWAKANIRFTKAESPDFAGPYNERAFPFFSEILRALSPDDPCRIVSLSKSAQLGGTVLGNVFTLGSVDLCEGMFLYIHPTTGNAQRWSKTKLVPMLKNIDDLSAQFPERSRDSDNSVLFKQRADGRASIQISGANSPSDLSMITVQRQVQDDLAKWVDDPKFGDPEKAADSRSQSMETAKIFKISTPGLKQGCRITRNFGEGSQERYHVPCPHCGHKQVLDWKNMVGHLDPAAPEKAAFICTNDACGCFIEAKHRADIVVSKALGGEAEWIAQHPERKAYHRSFHIWSAYGPLFSWGRLAREYFSLVSSAQPEQPDSAKADGSDLDDAPAISASAEQNFFNDKLGLPYEVKLQSVDWEALAERGNKAEHTAGTIPAGALIRCLGIDIQENRVEWALWGFGRGVQRFPIERGIIDGVSVSQETGIASRGNIAEEQVRTIVAKLIDRTWPDEFGNHCKADMAAVDGNYLTDDVYLLVKRFPSFRAIMVRGNPRPQGTYLKQVSEQKTGGGKVRKYGKRFYNLDVGVLKVRLYRDVARQDRDEPGYVHFPRGFEQDFFEQLVAENRIAKIDKTGNRYFAWDLPNGKRNEMLDCANYAFAAFIRMGGLGFTTETWDKLEAERNVVPDHPQRDFEELLTPVAQTPADEPAHPASESLAERLARLARAQNGQT